MNTLSHGRGITAGGGHGAYRVYDGGVYSFRAYPITLASLQHRDGASRVFTDQAYIAWAKGAAGGGEGG